MNIKQKLIIVGIITFVLGFIGSYYFLSFRSKGNNKIDSENQSYSNLFEEVQENNEQASDSFGAVLLGSGGAGHSGGGLTDSIIVVYVNPKDKKAVAVSIPRDLYVPGNRKINAEVSVNGIESIKNVLKGITGLDVTKYASIDFDSLVKLIDNMGGIEVQVPKTFDDHFYPVKGLENELCGKSPEEIVSLHQKYSGFELEKQFTCRYEHIHFDQGITKIDGQSALKFARSRHGDSDFGRSQRQFSILMGIVKKLTTQSPFDTIEEAYNSVTKLIKTDLSLEEALELFEMYGDPNSYEITQIQLTDQNVLVSGKGNAGEYILLPKSGKNNFNEIKSYISGQLK